MTEAQELADLKKIVEYWKSEAKQIELNHALDKRNQKA
jgi:hypothetical protein